MNVFDLFAKLDLDSSAYEKGLAGAQSKASSFGKGLASAAKAGLAAVGAAATAVTAFAGTAVKAGADFDKSMSQVAATMGKTTDEIKDLRDFAQEMGSTTAFSATQAADALNYMALAGYDAETSMSMLPNVLNLAAAGGIDLAYASDMVTDASSALGLSIEETAKMVDQMAATSSKSNTSVSQLGEAILTIGATARSIKGGTTELNTLLGALADNGIKGAEGGTHLRNMILSLQNPTDEAAETLDQLGIAVYDADGNMRSMVDMIVDLQGAINNMDSASKDAVVSGIFNKTDLAAVNALLNTAPERFGELTNEIQAASFSSNSFKDALKDVGLSFTNIEKGIDAIGDPNLTGELENYLKLSGNNAENLAQMLYEDADATVSYEDIVNALGGDLNKLQEAFDNTTGAAQQMAETQLDNLAGDVTLFKSALEGVQIAVSDGLSPALREFVQLGTEGLGHLTTIFSQFDATPYLDATGNMTEEGAKAQVEFAANQRKATDDLFNTLTEGIGLVIDKIPTMVDVGMKLLEAIGKGILDNLDTIIGAAVEIANGLLTGLISALPQMMSGLMELMSGLLEGIVNVLPELLPTLFDGIINLLPQLLDLVVQIVSGLASMLVENAPLLISSAIEMIWTLAQGLVDALPEILPAIAEVITSIAISLTDPENLMKLIDAAIKIIIAVTNGLIQAIPVLLESVPQIIMNLVTALIESGPQIAKSGLELITSLVLGIGEALFKVGEAAGKLVATFGDNIKKRFEDAKNWGKDLIKNFIDGIKAKWEALKETIGNVAQTVKDFLGFSEPKFGPLSNFHTYAPDMIDLFVKGINDSKNKLIDAVSSAFDFEDYVTINTQPYLQPQESVYNYNINVNQPVSTPDEMARAIRTESQYGLIAGAPI